VATCTCFLRGTDTERMASTYPAAPMAAGTLKKNDLLEEANGVA
jgi:hypothetical protein